MSKEREFQPDINTQYLLDQVSRLTAENAMIKEKWSEAQPEQEPVAWITEWVQRYRHNDTPIMDSAVSFTKGGAPAVPNPNYIPLYTAQPKREPLGDNEISKGYTTRLHMTQHAFYDGVKFAEKAHGIGGEE